MKIALKKSLRDLSANKVRTILVILAIFFGVFGTGLILDLYSIVGREMDSSFMDTNPHSFSIRINDYNAELISFLSETNGVKQVEARRTVRARTEIAPDVWITSYLFVVEDFDNVQIDTFTSVAGASIPSVGGVLIEKESLPVMGIQVGETANMKISLNAPYMLTIDGSVHAPGLKPAWIEKSVYGYITQETLDLLGVPSESYDLMFVVSDEVRFDKNAIREIAFKVRDTFISNGYEINRVTVPAPGKHPNGDQMNALLFLFQLFGGLSLVLSSVLVVNMISSMLSGQVRQIGIMKAVGAKRSQIAAMYYIIVLFCGTVALVLAIPFATFVSKMLVNVCASMLNFSVTNYHIPLWPFIVQLGVGLLVPMLSATYPILRGTKTTVREALHDYGTNKQQFGSSRLDTLLGQIQGARSLLLSVRNTFRRKGRLILTVATLAVGGAILIVSLNVKSSLDNTIATAMTSLNYDLQYYLSKPYPESEVVQAVKSIPGVAKVEMLAGAMSVVVYEDGTENNAFQLAAVPDNLETLNLPVLQGRFIEPGDTNAIAINHTYLDNEPNLRIGDTVTIKTNGQNVEWVVVGVVKEVGAPAKAYVNAIHYQKIFSQVGYARFINIITEEHTTQAQKTASTLVEQALSSADIDILISSSFSDTKDVFINHLAIIAGFLVASSVLVIIVGVMGLVSTMSMNIMERMREIGIMRSYGATSKDVLHIVIFEGIFIAVISWAISLVLSIPLSFLVGDMFGGIFLQTPLDNVLNPMGYALWLIIVITITSLVGFGITLKMLEVPVNEVLSYE